MNEQGQSQPPGTGQQQGQRQGHEHFPQHGDELPRGPQQQREGELGQREGAQGQRDLGPDDDDSIGLDDPNDASVGRNAQDER